VVECLRVTGRFDFLLKVMVKDIQELDRLITDQLSKIDEIGHMESFIILNTVKKSWTIPIDYSQKIKV
jgi:DNA-binding Lrp family transcriptional regulator